MDTHSLTPKATEREGQGKAACLVKDEDEGAREGDG